MSKDYNFYFDETYHDKAITLSERKLNILADNILDDYIGFFWGAREDKIPETLELFLKVEIEFKKAFSMSAEKELKSRCFSNNQFKYGVKSFSNVLLNFYTKLFDVCIDRKLIFQIEIISKMEILVRRLFPDGEWFRRNCFIYDVFVYSFSKMLINYNHQELIDVLCRLDGATNEECIGVESKDNIGVRISDWLVGFIGKMIWGLVHDPQVIEEKIVDIEAIKTPDFSRRRLINSKWFDLNEKQFDCYKKAAKCFITQQPHKWTILHCTYADHYIQFTTLLRYINQFTFDQYIQIGPETHRDKYTEFCLIEMQAYYKTIEKI